MNKTTASAMLAIAWFAGSIASAQTIQQSLNINLTVFSTTDMGVKPIRIKTKDVIRYFAGTDVPGGKLLLVTPAGNAPGTLGDLNAFLRITSKKQVVLEVPSPDSFNLFQDAAELKTSGRKITSYSTNRFSIDFGMFHAELQGASKWSIGNKVSSGVDLSGSGAFVSRVSGQGTVDGVTAENVPIQGTIMAGPPKPGL